ncbi:MAG: HAD family hydrolase [Terriglobales bacterium]
MPSIIFFDVGGVLLTNGWDHGERARAAQNFSLDHGELELRHAPAARALECGDLSLDQYLDQVVFHQPRSFSREQFRTFMESCSQPLPESLALLPELAASGIRLATLNNEGCELNQYRIARFQLDRYFSAFCCSCYLGARKPEPEIFQRALGILHARPQECAFVDDREENLAAPRSLGFTCYLFRSAAQLRHDLQI